MFPFRGHRGMARKTYTKAKQVVARQIRALSHFFHKYNNGQVVEQCRELMVKLAEDRFILAVVGQFKRGKSSLMNAIIGGKSCPRASSRLPLLSPACDTVRAKGC